jgi:branched-chain amino acid transport system permease protein
MLKEFVVNWLLTGSRLMIVAIGFTLIFGVGGVLNLAHGTSIVLGAFSMYVVVSMGQSIWIGLFAAILVPVIFNAILYLTMVRKVDDEPVTTMIVTFVVFLIFEHVLLIVYGDQSKSIPDMVPGRTELLGYSVGLNQIALFVLSWVVVGGLFYFVNYTRIGKATIAMSMSTKGASLVGIDYTRVNLLIWMVAAGMAGLGGIFIGASQTVSWDMALTPLLMSFVIVILGGIGSIRGSVVGAYIIGFVEMFTIYIIDPTLRVFTPLLVLLIVILIKPKGLFGREFVE